MKKIYMVGNTHFDPVWLWRWDEAMSSIIATFRSALARMEEYPDFTYSFSAPAVLEWIKNTDEDLFEEIKKRVYSSIEYVGLSEDYLDKSPFDLSGGEKRRVAIAGVISMEPKVLILDEPTAGLDPLGKNNLL